MVKEIKAFRTYLVGAKIIAYVSNVAVKDVFVQTKVTRRRCRWINRIQEFDIQIQITKLVRGQGLAKLMAELNFEASQLYNAGEEEAMIASIENTSWYTNIMYYLKN